MPLKRRQLAVGGRREFELPLHRASIGRCRVARKRATVDVLPFGRFLQPLRHAGQRRRVCVEPCLGRRDNANRVEHDLTEGVAIDVEGLLARERFAQRQTLLGVRMGILGDQMKVCIFDNCCLHGGRVPWVG